MVSALLSDCVQLTSTDQVVVLNSAADAFVSQARHTLQSGALVLAEDNVSTLGRYRRALAAQPQHFRHVPFHTYLTQQPATTMDVVVLNLLYQPGKAWMLYALSVAAHALRIGGRFYATGAKDRGILSFARYMQEVFGNVETLEISKGHRVLCATKHAEIAAEQFPVTSLNVFADNKLDEGTRMLLDVLAQQEIEPAARVLDLGCGAGFLGVSLAPRVPLGHVTMVDASLAAVSASQQAVKEAGVDDLVTVQAGDGASDLLAQRFDLVVTNPPFHQGGIQTREIAERFIRDAAQVLLPHGKLFLVANRFLKYESTLQEKFRVVTEVSGDSRYKVLSASIAQK